MCVYSSPLNNAGVRVTELNSPPTPQSKSLGPSYLRIQPTAEPKQYFYRNLNIHYLNSYYYYFAEVKPSEILR